MTLNKSTIYILHLNKTVKKTKQYTNLWLLEIRTGVTWSRRGITAMGYKKLWDGGNILYLDWNKGYKTYVYTYVKIH